MTRGILTAALAVASASLFAQALVPMNDAMLKATGGRVMRPGTQKGEIVYVNCQGVAKTEWIAESIAYFEKETHFKISLKAGKFNMAKPEIQGNMSLFIVDDATLPSLLAAPENRWAMVNVATLKCEKEQFFAARVKKELTRGFAYLCGGTDSSYQGALTGPVTKAADLDTHVDNRLPVDVLARFQKVMPAFGVEPGRYMTYIGACKQGWAPAPTNDYQKAIWDKVHAAPETPMKIEFDPKKGR